MTSVPIDFDHPGELTAWMRKQMWRWMPERIALGKMQQLVEYDCLATSAH